MSFSDETINAYVDGELDPTASAAIAEEALRDSSLEQRIARARALRERLRAAYAPELEEPVPERLLAALSSADARPAPAVADLEAARAARAIRAARPATYVRYSLAASVLLAIGAGFFVWRHEHAGRIENIGGTLVAQGSLAEGLSNDLAGGESRVRIGLSFLAKSGDYCRTFSLQEDAGLACRRGGRWEILTLVKEPLPQGAAESPFRTAGSPIPAPIIAAAEAQMAGEPLDRAGEIAARARHWSPAKQQ